MFRKGVNAARAYSNVWGRGWSGRHNRI